MTDICENVKKILTIWHEAYHLPTNNNSVNSQQTLFFGRHLPYKQIETISIIAIHLPLKRLIVWRPPGICITVFIPAVVLVI